MGQLYTFLKLTRDEVDTAVKIHMAAFPNFFLTSLGHKVLVVFYRALINDKSIIAFSALQERKIIGFFVVSIQPAGLYTKIFIKHIFSFLFPLLFAFLRHPVLLKRMIISFTSQKSHSIPKHCDATLLSICVDPSFSGKGIGTTLLSQLEDELRKRAVKGYYLTTDADNNQSANQFYLKNEFVFYTSFLQGNRKMNLYSKYLK